MGGSQPPRFHSEQTTAHPRLETCSGGTQRHSHTPPRPRGATLSLPPATPQPAPPPVPSPPPSLTSVRREPGIGHGAPLAPAADAAWPKPRSSPPRPGLGGFGPPKRKSKQKGNTHPDSMAPQPSERQEAGRSRGRERAWLAVEPAEGTVEPREGTVEPREGCVRDAEPPARPRPAFPRWHSPSPGPSGGLVPSPTHAQHRGALPAPALPITPARACPWAPRG